jgi:hypothetical protein
MIARQVVRSKKKVARRNSFLLRRLEYWRIRQLLEKHLTVIEAFRRGKVTLVASRFASFMDEMREFLPVGLMKTVAVFVRDRDTISYHSTPESQKERIDRIYDGLVARARKALRDELIAMARLPETAADDRRFARDVRGFAVALAQLDKLNRGSKERLGVVRRINDLGYELQCGLRAPAAPRRVMLDTLRRVRALLKLLD